jgi:uncharacterized protein YndB with AHSA1/START domain
VKNTAGRVALLFCAATLVAAPLAGQAPPAGEPASEEVLEALAHLVDGEWRGQTTLQDGAVIRVRHVFTWGLNGSILTSKTYGAVGDAPERLVYEGFFGWHPEREAIVFREFSTFGGLNEGTIEAQENALHFAWREYGPTGAAEYRETLRFPDRDRYSSEAFKKTADGWEKFADSSFRRHLLPAAETSRTLRKEVTVAAPVAEVWRAWTTTEGVTTFFGPEAEVEARLGGPFEIYFFPAAPAGLRGSEGCKVHSLVPMQLLVFEWNAPPPIPAIRNSGLHTLVTIRLQEDGPNRTRVEMTQTGWGVGEDWDKTYAYFDKAWDSVLSNLEHRFRVGPVKWPGHFIRAGQQAAPGLQEQR